jgi:hypothetical protein
MFNKRVLQGRSRRKEKKKAKTLAYRWEGCVAVIIKSLQLHQDETGCLHNWTSASEERYLSGILLHELEW